MLHYLQINTTLVINKKHYFYKAFFQVKNDKKSILLKNRKVDKYR